MGETRVDLLHLLEDLRDAYPGSLEETILTEIMANALDSGASTISCRCDPADSTMTVIDNGSGMQRRDLARFHNIASSTKVRGQGIGFAGVGMRASHGCIRLYPEDIATIFETIPVGTKVTVVNQPLLYRAQGGTFYVQSYPPHEEHPEAKQAAAGQRFNKKLQDRMFQGAKPPCEST